MFDDSFQNVYQLTYYKWLVDYRNKKLESIGI